MALLEEISRVILIGGGATLLLDSWLLLLNRLGVQTLNMALIGRWVGHGWRGQFTHAAIGKASPIEHEALLGWLTHYAVGIAFALLLIGIVGIHWTNAPSLGVALLMGSGTVIFPWLVMQPAMGLGMAASKTAAPIKNSLKSLINHTIFGAGLFLSACVVRWIF